MCSPRDEERGIIMPTKVLVPLLGEGVEEVSIVTWLKAEGDKVEEYEGLLEVETDKVVTEIPSPAEGVVLKIFRSRRREICRRGDAAGMDRATK